MSTNEPKKQKKTEALTLRLDPRMKFQIELLSRIWHQSITGVIETAVERVTSEMKVSKDGDLTVARLAWQAWSPDDAEHLVRMAVLAPHLMTHEETCIWAAIEAADEDCFFRYWISEKGVIKSARVRTKVIKRAWPLLMDRAEQIRKFGSSDPITIDELEDFLGASVDSIKESDRADPMDKVYQSQSWLSQWSSAEEGDLMHELGADAHEES